MRVAVVGAGYAGLALSFHLLRLGAFVTVFDEKGIGQGASGASTGLLHPYPSKNVRRTERADEAMQAASELLEQAANALGKEVASHTGIVRFAMNEAQKETFREPRPDAKWLDEAAIKERFFHVDATEALWIPGGKTVFSKLYLQGLWLASEKLGACFETRRIEAPQELSGFDRVVFATGSDAARFKLPLNAKYGQALLCRWPKGLAPLPCSYIGQGHISLTEDPDLCLIGSTYEREMDPNRALSLREQIGVFFPPARTFEVVDIQWGVRMSPKLGYLPLIEQIAPSVWVFAGLGSRGLLYHGLYGKELAAQLVL